MHTLLHVFAVCCYCAAADFFSGGTAKELPVRNILILGKTGNGKSTTGNVFAGRDVFVAADEMTSVTQTANKMSWQRFGVRYMFVDTPGIFDTERSHEEIFREITNVIYLAPEGFHAIYFQLNPSSRFTAEEQRTVEGLIAITGGRDVLNHVTLVFSHGDKWPRQRILDSAAAGKLPKALTSLISDVEQRVVSVDYSSATSKEQSAQAIHDAITHICERHDHRPYTNKHFEHAKANIETIALSVDPEGRIKAMESEMEQKEQGMKDNEAELQLKLAEERKESLRREQDIAARLRAEMELEFARREIEAQKAKHAEQLLLEQEIARMRNDVAIREQQIARQQAEMELARQQAEYQRQRDMERQESEMRWKQAEMQQQLVAAKRETQHVIYRDTASRSSGSWCSVL